MKRHPSEKRTRNRKGWKKITRSYKKFQGFTMSQSREVVSGYKKLTHFKGNKYEILANEHFFAIVAKIRKEKK